MAYVGLAYVGPWVRVDPGGGSPGPWEKQGLRLGLGVLALAPEDGCVPLVLGEVCSCVQGGFGYCNVSSWVRVGCGGGCPRP